MREQDEHNPSLEEHALANYTIYWEHTLERSKHETKWEKLQASIYDMDTLTVNEMVREACVEMFKQGVLLRLTGE